MILSRVRHTKPSVCGLRRVIDHWHQSTMILRTVQLADSHYLTDVRSNRGFLERIAGQFKRTFHEPHHLRVIAA